MNLKQSLNKSTGIFCLGISNDLGSVLFVKIYNLKANKRSLEN